jgi:KUP system potassium uptake protein
MLAVAWIVSALVARERALAKRARVAADQAQDLRAPLATLHERNVILTVDFRDVPWVDDAERVSVEALAPGFWRVRAAFGFMEPPDVPRALALAAPQGLVLPMFETSYLLSRETVVPGAARGGMALWRERLFAAMSRASSGVAGFFRLPDNAVVELGTRVQI